MGEIELRIPRKEFGGKSSESWEICYWEWWL